MHAKLFSVTSHRGNANWNRNETSPVPTGTPKTQNGDIRSWRGYKETGSLVHCWREYEVVQRNWKTVRQFLKKQDMQLHSGIYPREMKTHVHTETYTDTFIAPLFIVAKHWKLPRCPSTSEWLNRLWHIHTTEHCSAIKRNKCSVHSLGGSPQNYATWKKSNLKKVAYYMVPLYDSICITFLK